MPGELAEFLEDVLTRRASGRGEGGGGARSKNIQRKKALMPLWWSAAWL